MKYLLLALGAFTFMIHFCWAQVKPSELDKDFVRIERVSQKASGFYYGLKEQDKFKRYEATGCNFIYEKGIGSHPKSNRDYAYERFMISFSGLDKKQVTSFDSVLYGHSDYVGKFKRLDFSKSFPYRSIKRVELEDNKESGQMKAVRTELGELHLLFRHKEVFNSQNSSFFEKGEVRQYEVEVQFSSFSPTEIKLKKVNVTASKKVGKGAKKKIVSVNCKDFSAPE